MNAGREGLRWQRAEELFHRALTLECSTAERAAAVAAWCEGDRALAEDVLSLLGSADALDAITVKPSGAASEDSWLGQVLGGYRITGLIGQGGMGTVYSAIRTGGTGKEEEQVAIKVVRTRLFSPLLQDRFLEERKALAALRHPHIGHLLDGGMSKAGEPYLVMEYIDGERLDRYCERADVSREQIVELFLQLCEAVAFAHSHRILHGDLKPSNVMVTAEGGAKLLDFGCASLLPAESSPQQGTATPLAAFTPEYASPEQMRGETCTATADVYSLGAMLHRLLSGCAPAASTTALASRLMGGREPGGEKETVSNPPAASGQLDEDLRAIAAKAMSADSSQRYASVADLAADLVRYRDQWPVRARPPAPHYREAKFLRRRKRNILLALALLIAFIAGGAAVLHETRIARAEELRARMQMLNVRHLANFLVTDLYDRLTDVPGSTPTQHKAAAESLSFLDGMSRDAVGDAGFEMDLANAYTRLGNVLGSRYGANLGDARAGIKTVEKAVNTARDALRLRPDDPAALRCAISAEQSLSELQFSDDQTHEAMGYAMAAATLSEKLVRLPGATAADLRAEASVYSLIGDEYGLQGEANLGDAQAAMANYRKSLELDQAALARDSGDAATMRAISVEWQKIANMTREAQPEVARKEYQSALEMLARIPNQTASIERSRAFLEERIGICDFYEHKYRESLREFLPAQRTQEAAVARDPLNMRFQPNLSIVYLDEGQSHEALNQWEAARTDFQRLAALLARALRRDPQNHVWQEHYAQTLISLADVEGHIAGSAGDAEENERKGLALAVRLAEEAGAVADDMDNAALFLLDAEPRELRDPRHALALSSRAVALTHSADPDLLFTLARAYAACHRVAEAKQTALKVLAMQPGLDIRNAASDLLKTLKAGRQ
jgi:non-specific serine/threonine protein kinase/serine/threonine-protein kinase